MKPFLYESPILPEGFRFPAQYLDKALDEQLDLVPWRLLSNDMPTSLFYYGSMLLKFPGRVLIPFAIIQDDSGQYNDGWVVLACFDGSDSSVRIYDYGRPKSSPWDNAAYPGFTEWLAAATEESARYKAELLEDDD